MKAMNGLALRQNAIAENVANANSAGVAPLRVSFETALRRAAEQGASAVDAVTPQLTRGSAPAGGQRLDLELVAATQTAMRYTALVDLANRRMELDRLAVSGAR